MKKLKIMSVVGTRPEIIRLSRVLAEVQPEAMLVLGDTRNDGPLRHREANGRGDPSWRANALDCRASLAMTR